MVAFVDFVKEVKKEIVYFQDGGTSRRKLVVSLSVVVLHETDIRTVEYFHNKYSVIDLVQDLIPCIENELAEDIAEFLSHVAKDLTRNLPTVVTEYVEMQKQKRKGKPLCFKENID